MNIAKKLKVFLIEDAIRIRSVLIDILQQTGDIEVIGYAENEKDALNQLRSKEWDVAIVDIGLREGNGLAVLAGLKSDAKAYGRRLVFTSNPSLALKARTMALGAEAFFDKSRDMDVLVNHIQAMVH
ncbi:MAG: response regulator [Pseudomonadota bacterium]